MFSAQAAKRSAELSPRASAAVSGGGLGAAPPSVQFVFMAVLDEPVDPQLRAMVALPGPWSRLGSPTGSLLFVGTQSCLWRHHKLTIRVIEEQ
jgi:hypothetical protein